MSDLDMETKIVGLAAPTTSVWAVFAAIEGDDEEIWMERIHLWAQTRTALSEESAGEEAFLGREVPPARDGIQGMVVCEGDLVLVKETGEWLFLGYSENEKPPVEDWRSAIRAGRRRFAREMAQVNG